MKERITFPDIHVRKTRQAAHVCLYTCLMPGYFYQFSTATTNNC